MQNTPTPQDLGDRLSRYPFLSALHGRRSRRFGAGIEFPAYNGQRAPEIKVLHTRCGNIEPAMVVMQQRAIVGCQAVSKLVEPLRAPHHQVLDARKRSMLRQFQARSAQSADDAYSAAPQSYWTLH